MLYPQTTNAHYPIPLDTLLRGAALPVAAMNALFPAFAHAGPDSDETGKLVAKAGKALLAVWGLPLCVIGAALPSLLTAWVGADFAAGSLQISEWLLLGVLANGFAHIPYALLQSAGRTDITGKLHIIELPIYAIMLITLTSAYGIVGAAAAWTTRSALDTLLLYALAWAHFVKLRSPIVTAAAMVVLAMTALLVILIFRSS